MPRALRQLSRASWTASTRSPGVIASQKRRSSSSASDFRTLATVQTLPPRRTRTTFSGIAYSASVSSPGSSPRPLKIARVSSS